MPFSRDTGLIFVFIPKNAGTSICEALDMEAVHHHTWQTYAHLQGGTRFCVVRNPFDRLVSCWSYARMATSYHHALDGPSRHGAHPDHADLACLSFKNTVRHMVDTRVPWQHPSWLPQYLWVTDDAGTLQVDRVLRFEQLQGDLDALLDDCELPRVSLPHLNRSQREDWREHYDAQTLGWVHDLYGRDLDLFDYDDR